MDGSARAPPSVQLRAAPARPPQGQPYPGHRQGSRDARPLAGSGPGRSWVWGDSCPVSTMPPLEAGGHPCPSKCSSLKGRSRWQHTPVAATSCAPIGSLWFLAPLLLLQLPPLRSGVASGSQKLRPKVSSPSPSSPSSSRLNQSLFLASSLYNSLQGEGVPTGLPHGHLTSTSLVCADARRLVPSSGHHEVPPGPAFSCRELPIQWPFP